MTAEKNHLQDVPKQILETFLSELKKTEIPAEVIARLKDTVKKDKLTETDIKEAMFSSSEDL